MPPKTPPSLEVSLHNMKHQINAHARVCDPERVRILACRCRSTVMLKCEVYDWPIAMVSWEDHPYEFCDCMRDTALGMRKGDHHDGRG